MKFGRCYKCGKVKVASTSASDNVPEGSIEMQILGYRVRGVPYQLRCRNCREISRFESTKDDIILENGRSLVS